MAKAVKKVTPQSRRSGKEGTASANGTKRSVKGFDVEFDPAAQLKRLSATPPPVPSVMISRANPDVMNRLWTIIESRRSADPEMSHSARLLAKGKARVAQKLGEEAVECLLEVMAGSRAGIIGESADVLYHLLVAWVSADIRPEEIWHELEQRERISQLVEGDDVPLKRMLGSVQINTTKIP